MLVKGKLIPSNIHFRYINLVVHKNYPHLPELVDNKQVFTLYEVASSIRKTLAERYTSPFWIKTEINKLNIYAKSGHCFPELVDKKDGKIEAEMRATIWKTDFERINANFKKLVKEPLKDGIKVLMKATISYDPKYGLSLFIQDIDPSFSLGELEKEKKETIAKLQQEGLFGKNQLLPIALLPKRIAIISVDTSKGYSDFIKVIDQNIFGYRFFHMLFPAVLQGEASIASITRQLKNIKKVKKHFDAVAIIRGGGGDVGLSSFNNYQLAKAICSFPLPVFTGIGHSTNLTVSEMVAFQNAITPTELADFFLQKFHNFAVPLQRAEETIVDESILLIENEKKLFKNTVHLFKTLTRNRLKTNHDEIRFLSSSLLQETKFRLSSERELLVTTKRDILRSTKELMKEEKNELDRIAISFQKDSQRFFNTQFEQLKNLEKIVQLVDPMNVVKRGYTITNVNGKILKSVEQIKEGDILNTFTADGNIDSQVTKIKKSN